MILDTNFLGALKDQDPAAQEKAAELEVSGRPLRVPTIVAYELFISVGKADQRAYQRLIANKPVVEMSESIAKRAGVLEGTHQRSDDRAELGAGDAIVASTALEFSEPVVSDDGDFDDVDGLTRVGF